MTCPLALATADYGDNGCCGPIRVLDADAAAALLARIDAVRPDQVAAIAHPWIYKSYLLFTWMDALVRTPAILDAVAPIVGPDILVMSADIWRKAPGETRHISFHQDAGYWYLDPPEIVTAWVALTPATRENGCMQFALGTHKLRLVAHDNTYAPDNMLSHGQTARIDLSGYALIDDVLEPGEMSLHHALLAHGSGPNTTDAPRVGICIRYLPGRIATTQGPPVSAMVVRGRHHGNLTLETPPAADLSAEAIAQHTRLLEPHAATRYVNF
ncbi:MAG: phytanoyl-CoA dioxygenase family protein [Proteobacteria bacterium]|nr:phytanoyl-CoA dioxygenase family protein [Pseudomonadota bacterium]MDA1071585.1 phytanoyl-CoA dioxygenase family protein [Pseudomonadota bacterium]